MKTKIISLMLVLSCAGGICVLWKKTGRPVIKWLS